MVKGDFGPETELVATTDNYNYLVMRAEEPDGEVTYHLQLNNVTIHFFQEEWDEFIVLAEILTR